MQFPYSHVKVRCLCNDSLSFFFESHKNHASVKFAAETDDLDVCCVSAIALAFSGLLSSLDRCSCTLMYSFFGTLPSSLEVSERDHHI